MYFLYIFVSEISFLFYILIKSSFNNMMLNDLYVNFINFFVIKCMEKFLLSILLF